MSRDDRIVHDRAADAAAYALGALDASEEEAYRRHLGSCAQCRAELAAFTRVADVLPAAVAQYPAPRGLRRRVMRGVRAGSRPRTRPGLAAAVALAIVAALIVAVRGYQAPLAGPRVLAAKVVSFPGTAKLRIAGGHGELIVRHLPAPAAGRVYEIWLKRPSGAPVPTRALFSVTTRGSADVGVPGELSGVSEILVTQEPAGGSRVPSGPPVIVAATS